MKENIIIIEKRSINLQRNKYSKYFLKYFLRISDIFILKFILTIAFYILKTTDTFDKFRILFLQTYIHEILINVR